MTNIASIQPPASLRLAIRSDDDSLREWITALNCGEIVSANESGIDFILFGDDFSEKLSDSDDDTPKCAAGLFLLEPFTGSYMNLYHHGITHIVYRNAAFAREALNLALLYSTDKVLDDVPAFSEFGSAPEFQDEVEKKVVSSEDARIVLQMSDEFLQKHDYHDGTRKALCLCIKEAVTNAIFHGFRESGSHTRKYEPAAFHGMYDDDCVIVKMRLTPEWLAISIYDNSGSLGPMSVVNSLDRHHSNRGLMDERGRGFYLMHQLANRLVITIDRRKRTCVDLYFSRTEAEPGAHHFQMVVR